MSAFEVFEDIAQTLPAPVDPPWPPEVGQSVRLGPHPNPGGHVESPGWNDLMTRAAGSVQTVRKILTGHNNAVWYEIWFDHYGSCMYLLEWLEPVDDPF